MSKPNAIILIDYENLYRGANSNHQLKMTMDGFKHLIDQCQTLFDVPNEKIFIACHYKEYSDIESEIERSDFVGINAIEKADNMADGYLIAFGTQALVANEGSYNEVVLIAGDKIYTGMVRVAAKLANKIHVLSWEDSLAGILKNAHHKVRPQLLEDIFDLKENRDVAIQKGWFESYALNLVEKEIIRFVLKGKNPNGFMLVTLANILKKWTNCEVANHFGGDYHKILDYLKKCSQDQGFFEMVREPGTEGKDDIFWLKLKKDHVKVQQVIANKEK